MTRNSQGAAASLANQGSSVSVSAQNVGAPSLSSTNSVYDGSSVPDGQRRSWRITKNTLHMGTWNVRSMLQLGTLDIVYEELKRCSLDVLGVCETRWASHGYFSHKDYTIFHSGAEKKVKRA